jgi:hypothetical protein
MQILYIHIRFALAHLSSSEIESIGFSTPQWGGSQSRKEKPMEKLTRLFGRSIRFAYHCFDRIVIRGYLSTLSRPENIEYFFRTIKQVECIGKDTLRQRTDQYLSWVSAYTGNHPIHSIFERSCDLGLARITTRRIASQTYLKFVSV